MKHFVFSTLSKMLFFNYYINAEHPNIHFTMEWETHHDLPFLNVLINNTDPHLTFTPAYLKRTFPGLLSNNHCYLGFSPSPKNWD